MTYRYGDEPTGDEDVVDPIDDEEEPPEPTPPWRAAVVTTNPVIEVGPVEKWDDEIPVPTRQEEMAAAARR